MVLGMLWDGGMVFSMVPHKVKLVRAWNRDSSLHGGSQHGLRGVLLRHDGSQRREWLPSRARASGRAPLALMTA